MGLVLAAGFMGLVVALVVLAGLQGRLRGVALLPNPDITGPSVLDQPRGVFSTVPVIALAYVCHYNIHPCAALPASSSILMACCGQMHLRWRLLSAMATL